MNFARSLAVSLALCAMVLRAVLPDGWMPAAGASPFVICSLGGTHKDDKAPAQAPSRHAPCAFASSAPLAPPALAASIPGEGRSAPHLAVSFTDDIFVPTPLHRPNAARAPPALA